MNIESYIRKDLRNLQPYSSARSEFDGDAVTWLDANENGLVKEYNRYPDSGQQLLKNSISELKNIPVDQLFLGNGSDEVLDLIMRLTCRPFEDTIAFFDPSYGMYAVLARLNGLNVKPIRLNETFECDRDELFTGLKNVRVFFLCNPNNPTGNVCSAETIRGILSGFAGLLVIDEAYIDFCPELSSVALLAEFPNLIIVQTLSKAYGMAGLRIGMAIAAKEWIAAMNSIKPPYNISSVAAETAVRLLATENWENLRLTVVSERERVTAGLQAHPVVIRVFESRTNFVLFRSPYAAQIYRFLAANGIVVRDRGNQFRCEKTLRVTIGSPAENDHFLQTLMKFNYE